MLPSTVWSGGVGGSAVGLGKYGSDDEYSDVNWGLEDGSGRRTESTEKGSSTAEWSGLEVDMQSITYFPYNRCCRQGVLAVHFSLRVVVPSSCGTACLGMVYQVMPTRETTGTYLSASEPTSLKPILSLEETGPLRPCNRASDHRALDSRRAFLLPS